MTKPYVGKGLLLAVLAVLFVFTQGCRRPANGEQSKGTTSLPTETELDLVILNGRVMDPETNFAAVSNVGVKDGKIAVITDSDISGAETIDASGHVVAPGFIDTHHHMVGAPFGQKLALRDGVTTPLELEVGAYPVDLFYDLLEGKSQTNYGATASLMAVREKVFNPKYTSKFGAYPMDSQIKDESMFFGIETLRQVPNEDQLEQIVEYLDASLKAGALGIGNPVGYMTAGVTSPESVAVQRLSGQYGVATYLHGRFSSHMPPTTGMLGSQEMIASVGIYGGGLMIQHMHQQTLADTETALAMIEDAKKKGLKVIAEIYPYNYGATVVGADYLKPDNYGPNMGRDYSDITEVATMKPLDKARYDELVKTNPMASITFVGIDQEKMLQALAHPGTTVGSDAFPLVITETGEMAFDWDTPYEAVQGHPRAAGTHAIVLRWVREKNLMPLMLAISKMSYMPAKFMEDNGVPQMKNKGRIQVGADADITIFDPETVTDNSTTQQAGLPSTGIPYVIVNGTVVVKDSKVLKDVYPGQPVRNDAFSKMQN